MHLGLVTGFEAEASELYLAAYMSGSRPLISCVFGKGPNGIATFYINMLNLMHIHVVLVAMV